MSFRKFKKAFTLVEIIVAVAALGTLYTMSTANFNSYREMSKNEQDKMNVQQVKNAVDNYYAKHSYYPSMPSITKDGTTKYVQPSKGSYSKIDKDALVTERYLQDTITLPNGQHFVVDSNGIVSIKSEGGESVVIEDGAVVVAGKGKATDVNVNIKFDIYADNISKDVKKLNKVVITGENGAVTCTSPGNTFSKTVSIKNKPGTKEFTTDFYYTGDTKPTRTIKSSIQYALDLQNQSDNFYWIYDKDVNNNKYIIPITPTVSKDVSLDWTNISIQTSIGVVNFEIERYVNGKVEKTFTTNQTTFTDVTGNSGVTYQYRVYAKNAKGDRTTNYLNTGNVKVTYTDNVAKIKNITKNDFNSATNKEVTVQAYDYEGISQVILHTFNISGATPPTTVKQSAFKTYIMYPTTTGIPYYDDKDQPVLGADGKQIQLTTYSVPIPILDDYMIYYVQVVDNRGYSTYSYYAPNGNPQDIVNIELPSNTAGDINVDQCYTLMKGLREIFSDGFADNSNIDANSEGKYHLYDGKITLP